MAAIPAFWLNDWTAPPEEHSGFVAGSSTTSGTIFGRADRKGVIAGTLTSAGVVTGQAGRAGTLLGSSTAAGTVNGKSGRNGAIVGVTGSDGFVGGVAGGLSVPPAVRWVAPRKKKTGVAATGSISGLSVTSGVVHGTAAVSRRARDEAELARMGAFDEKLAAALG